jgi:hypothetical protein
MIYINRTVTKPLFSSILSAAQSTGADRFVLWPYPEISNRTMTRLRGRFGGFMQGRCFSETATLYEGKSNEEYQWSFALSGDSITKLESLFSKLNRLCESVTTHRSGWPEFVSATIFHERMTLFKDEPKAEEILMKQGIRFTKEPPTWW